MRESDTVLISVRGAERKRLAVPDGSVVFSEINPWAIYRADQLDAARVEILVFNENGTVTFTLWTDEPDKHRRWPEGVLQEYAGGRHPGENYWTGRVPFADLTDFHDGIPDQWRPLLDGTEQSGS